MIQLPRWVLTDKYPAFYDTESVTSVEAVAKLYGAMQTLIEEYNTFAEQMETKVNEFIADTTADQETFQIGMRQEFQDFIDVVEMKLNNFDAVIGEEASRIINEAIQSGRITVTQSYDVNTEALNMVVTEEV